MKKRLISLLLAVVMVVAMIPMATLPASAVTIPAGYTRLEYLDGDGNAYIDTGIAASALDRFELKGAPLVNLTGGSFMGSGTDNTSDDRLQFHEGTTLQGISLRFNGTMSATKVYVLYRTYTFVIDLVDEIGTIDGDVVLEDHDGTFRTDLSIYLFTKNLDGNIDNIHTDAVRIYYYRQYRNNVLIRNMIPCSRNSDSVLGMYDTVNGVFYTNAGSGSFTAGPSLVPDSKLDPANIVASLSLLDNININVKLKNDGTNDLTGYTDFQLVVEDAVGNEIARWNMTGATDKYVGQLEVVAKDIHTLYSIHVEAKNGSGDPVFGASFDYGVVTYCDFWINDTTTSVTGKTQLVALCQAIEAYGDAATAYFNAM